MKFKMLYIFAIPALAGLGLVSGCATTTGSLPSHDDLLRDLTEQDGRSCIRTPDIRGFGVLEDDIISVDTNRNKEYFLITTVYRCPSLNFTPQLAFDGDFAEVCGGGRDRVVSGDGSCPIKSVYRFESRKAAFAAVDTIEQELADLKEQLKQNKTE